MLLKTKLLLYICLLFSLPLFCQEQQKELKGKVISDSLDVEGVHVINKTLKESTITNKEGHFKIQARINDTLFFSAVQFELKSVIVAPEIYIQEAVLIKLDIKVNKLDEVVVRPYNLSGNLMNDMKGANTDNIVNGVTLGLPNATVKMPTQSQRRVIEATTGGGAIPINLIINAITGYTKMLKNRVKLEKKEERLNETMGSFEKELYVNHLKIPEEYIDRFSYYCAADINFEEYQKQNDPLLMLAFFETKSKEFRLLNDID